MIPTSNLASLLLQTARRLPDRPALIWRDRRWTWAEVAARAAAAAGALRARGIGAGDRVLVHARNGNAIFESCWACWLIGAVWVPTNFRLSPPEAAYLAANAGCRAHVFDVAFPEHRAVAKAQNAACVLEVAIGEDAGFSWEDLIAEGADSAGEGDRGGGSGSSGLAVLYLGHHRPAEGWHADAWAACLRRGEPHRRPDAGPDGA